MVMQDIFAPLFITLVGWSGPACQLSASLNKDDLPHLARWWASTKLSQKSNYTYLQCNFQGVYPASSSLRDITPPAAFPHTAEFSALIQHLWLQITNRPGNPLSRWGSRLDLRIWAPWYLLSLSFPVHHQDNKGILPQNHEIFLKNSVQRIK